MGVDEGFPGFAMVPPMPMHMQYLPGFFGQQPFMQPQPVVQYAPLAPLIQQPQVMMQPQVVQPMHVIQNPGGQFTPGAAPTFDDIDRNHDGVISRAEYLQAVAGEPVSDFPDPRLAPRVIRPQPALAPAPSEICTNCGATLLPDSAFCQACGAPAPNRGGSVELGR